MTTNNPNPPKAPMFVSCEPGDVPLPAPTLSPERLDVFRRWAMHTLQGLEPFSPYATTFTVEEASELVRGYGFFEMLKSEHAALLAAARKDAARIAELEREVAGLRAGRRLPLPPKHERTIGCKCHWEEGDSPCPVHGEREE